MLKIAALLLVLGSAMAQYNQRTQDIVNYRTENNNEGNGNYNYLWENSDGTLAQERGYVKPPNPGEVDQIQVAEGSYQYYSPEGQLIKVTYIADENGFQATGDHLPTPPPIPEAIQKGLDIIYAGIARQKSQAELASGNYNGRFNKK